MRLLLDQGVARSVAEIMRGADHDVVHVGECGLANAEDDAILQHAREQQRVIVTFDSDFSALLALSGASQPSVIHVRIDGLKAEAQASLLGKLVEMHASALESGAILSVHPHAVRQKNLPIR